MQSVVIIFLALAAVVYLGSKVIRSFSANTCEQGCSKCSASEAMKIAGRIESAGKHKR